MRLIKITTPENRVKDVIELAFRLGIKKISESETILHHADGKREDKINLDIETSTPLAKRFVDELLAADFYSREDFTLNTRQPRSIISNISLRDLTIPIVEPTSEILEELWQFSRVTVSFVGRFFIGGCLLAFGLIHQQLLIIIAGLLFLPFLPLLLAISFGLKTGQWRLTAQGLTAVAAALILLISAGILIAAFSPPPVKYAEFNTLPVNFLISLAVGTAAVLASTDDVGRRELIGLAATSQLAIMPVWTSVCLILDFPATTGKSVILGYIISFPLNFFTIVAAAFVAYSLLGAGKKTSLKNLNADGRNG